MINKWNWMDELLRLAESQSQTKPKSITELLDVFNTIVPPSTWNQATDPVPPPAKEAPMAKNEMTSTIRLYSCPSCTIDVEGVGTYRLVFDSKPVLDETGAVRAEVELVSVTAPSHRCA